MASVPSDQGPVVTVKTGDRTVRVLVDVTGIDKTFDYLVAGEDTDRVDVGTQVRVRLGARNVRGWVVALDVATPEGIKLQRVRGIRGVGPNAELIELAHWAAWRWAGHPAQFLRSASPPSVVKSLPAPRAGLRTERATGRLDEYAQRDGLDTWGGEAVLDQALRGGASIVRLPPGIDRTDLIIAILDRAVERAPDGSPVVACPGRRAAARLVKQLRHAGFDVTDLSEEGRDTARSRAWAHVAVGGSVVVGTRNVAWASVPRLTIAVVVDEHDEAYQSTRTPTWHARDVLFERARRADVPFVQLSPCPSLEALTRSRLVEIERPRERAGWPRLEVIDRRSEDPRTASSLFSDRLGTLLANSGRTVCVLNRTGRIRLLACRSCAALVRCEHCGAAMHARADEALVCPRCSTTRPRVCAECGAAGLKNLRVGVSRARDELEALVAEPVAEVTKDGAVVGDPNRARIVIGTEAVLHRIGPVETVLFLDIDQELTAPRFRASEQAFALLARAARLAGPRASGHRLVVQTRIPDHPVLLAAADGDPNVLTEADLAQREALAFPPFSALALVSGAGAPDFVAGLRTMPVDVLDGGDGTWLVRAPDHPRLADALAGVPRPETRVRIEVDPLRV